MNKDYDASDMFEVTEPEEPIFSFDPVDAILILSLAVVGALLVIKII